MNAAWQRGWRKAVRTMLQLIASGGLTAAVDALAGGLSAEKRAVIAAVWLIIVTFAQNYAETAGRIPALLPTAGLVPSVRPVEKVIGVVETTVDRAGDAIGDIEGIVQDVTGTLIGEVVPPGEGES